MLSIKKNVEVSLITIGEIKESYISEVEFSRVMGIILENELEEASENDRIDKLSVKEYEDPFKG